MKRIICVLVVVAVTVSLSGCNILENLIMQDDGNHYLNYDQNINNEKQDTTKNDEYDEIVAICEKLVSAGDTLGAYQYIKSKADNNTIYGGLLQKYTKIFVEDTIQAAQRYAEKGNWQQAVNVLKEANKVHNCTEFASLIEDYESYLPHKLWECKRIDDEDYEYMLEAEDCFGNRYEEVFGFHDSIANDDGGYAIFYLNGKYNSLTGTFVGSNELYKDMEVDCRIYADGRLIYESPKMGRTSLPVTIAVDVSDVIQLRVEYMYYTWWTQKPCCIFDLTVS